MDYIKVKIHKGAIEVISKIESDGISAALKNKGAGEMVISVDKYKQELKKIKQHNAKKAKKRSKKYVTQTRNYPKWDTNKLNHDTIEKIKDLHSRKKYAEIIAIHNSKKLTDTRYCCAGHESHVDFNVKLLK